MAIAIIAKDCDVTLTCTHQGSTDLTGASIEAGMVLESSIDTAQDLDTLLQDDAVATWSIEDGNITVTDGPNQQFTVNISADDTGSQKCGVYRMVFRITDDSGRILPSLATQVKLSALEDE